MKTVYITGASAGLGRAIALAYAKEHYRVGLIARDESALIDTVASLGVSQGAEKMAAWASADVSVFSELEAAAQKLEALIGPPDIWINSAMATIFSRFEDIAPDEFARAGEVPRDYRRYRAAAVRRATAGTSRRPSRANRGRGGRRVALVGRWRS